MEGEGEGIHLHNRIGGGDVGIDGMKQVWDEGKRMKREGMKMINQEGPEK